MDCFKFDIQQKITGTQLEIDVCTWALKLKAHFSSILLVEIK